MLHAEHRARASSVAQSISSEDLVHVHTKVTMVAAPIIAPSLLIPGVPWLEVSYYTPNIPEIIPAYERENLFLENYS